MTTFVSLSLTVIVWFCQKKIIGLLNLLHDSDPRKDSDGFHHFGS